MKKFILASAFALMATPALFAQTNNSYSMQIELKDGTKITLGPNDLKNITFADGAIKIEGNTIEELRASILENKKLQQDQVEYLNEQLTKRVEDMKAQVTELKVQIYNNMEDIAMLQKELKEAQTSGGGGDTQALEKEINGLKAITVALEGRLDRLQEQQDLSAAKTDAIGDEMKAILERINGMEGISSYTSNKLDSAMTVLDANIEVLQAKLKDEAEVRIKGDAMNEEMIHVMKDFFKEQLDDINISHLKKEGELENKLDAIDEKHEAEEKKLGDKQEAINAMLKEVENTLTMFMKFVQENMAFNESFEDWLKKQGQQ